MADRRVTRTAKSSTGTIEAVCGDWGRTGKAIAVIEILNGTHRYFVSGPQGEVDVVVVQGDTEKYLRTEPDLTKADNLASLPNC
jgi:hypothetical protein